MVGDQLEDSQTGEDTEIGGPLDGENAEVEGLRAEVREANDLYLRTVAELKNIKRRHLEERDRIQDTATRNLVTGLLPVVDDLERALTAAQTSQNFEGLYKGVDLTLSKLAAALAAVGVSRIPSVGVPFDPSVHEAIQPVPASEAFPPGTVTAELQPGYAQHGHVLRHSLVAVAQD